MIPRNSFFFVDACPSSSLIRLIVNCFFTSLLYIFHDILAVLSLCGIALKKHTKHFNSRPSARGDAGAALLASRGKFSIHAPPRGATVSHFYSFLLPSFFNSRPSARGDMGVNTTSSRSPFQFTPLREGRPKKQEEPLDGQIFQFTPLREGAT